jgi:Tat protein translocase TatB subunit
MMNFGPIKLLFTAVAALLILGPKRLPSAVRAVGKAIGELKKASAEVTEELRSGLGTDEAPSSERPQERPRAVPQADPTSSDHEELRPGPR